MGEQTWLIDAPDASLGAVVGLRPELAERYDALAEQVWRSGVDPVLLELCRIRVAQLLGDAAGAALRTPRAVAAGLDEQLVVRLGEWWSHPLFGTVERAALATAEQFVVDVHGVSDEGFAGVVQALGAPGAVAFSMALALFDGQSRIRLVFAAPSSAPGGAP